ncbi:aldo reductase-1 [Coleophoma crateriformis]|uniref:Aldo reductase-1 n=1 Tax=Coleophoma crateriformis TaxID=565419 RepID=A0A3D8T7E3_9HELO|nr:aldo reductase-1 [Coleophoma crateriformis]
MTGKPTIKLNNGNIMPALGFGTFAEPLLPGTTRVAVKAALQAGWRHLDCAWIYANEDEVGAGLKEFLEENPEIKRSDIFITTKVWPHLFEPADVEWSLNDSLKKLGISETDLLLLHWPFSAERTADYQIKRGPDEKYIIKKDLTENLEPTWRAMEKLFKAGKAKSIGVSNWTIPGLEALLKYAEIQPAVNQVEIHPYFPNTELVEYLFVQDIIPVAYSPLGSQEGTGDRLLADKALQTLAAKKGCSLAQLLIAWGLKRGYAVLPKSQKADRIKSNFELVDLTSEEFAEISRAESRRGYRFVSCKELTEFNYDVWPEEER